MKNFKNHGPILPYKEEVLVKQKMQFNFNKYILNFIKLYFSLCIL